jgi:hypothetical protein
MSGRCIKYIRPSKIRGLKITAGSLSFLRIIMKTARKIKIEYNILRASLTVSGNLLTT